jgi:hypothetical protein
VGSEDFRVKVNCWQDYPGVQHSEKEEGGILGGQIPCHRVQTDEHLAKCLVYIDITMVRDVPLSPVMV